MDLSDGWRIYLRQGAQPEEPMSQGRKEKPEPVLFVEVTDLYGHIPKSHFYERLDQLLDLEFVYELTRPLYAERLGRPSLDPVVFFKCMLAGFFENVVFDTELEYRLADSLTLRRFLGYSLEERTPDESTLRKTRQSMPEEVFREVFSRVLDQCQAAGLLKGKAVGTDSTLVDANASMDSLRHKTLGCTYEEYVVALKRQDEPKATREEAKAADRQRAGKASNEAWVSQSDPEARVMQHADGHTHLSYRVDTTVDLQTGVIVTAGAELANISDQADFLLRVDEAVGMLSERGLMVTAVVADKGHHSGENLAGLQERGLVSLVSSPTTARGAEGYRREDFVYDPERDLLICPAGALLRRRQLPEGGKRSARQYQARGKECRGCPHFGVCTTSQTGRAVSVPIHEELIRANRQRVRDPDLRPLVAIRRQRGEGPFGYFKQFGGLRRFAGRGLDYAAKKALIAAVGWNLLCLLRQAAASGAGRLFTAALMALLAALSRLGSRLCRVLAPIRDAAVELSRRRRACRCTAPRTAPSPQIGPLSACC
jgi:transposase